MATVTMDYDNLIGSLETREFRLPLKDATAIVRGEVMAYNTSTNKVESYNSTGTNGVNAFYGIATEDVAAGTGQYISVYVQGEFNTLALVFSHSGDSATQTFINSARTQGVILKSFRA